MYLTITNNKLKQYGLTDWNAVYSFKMKRLVGGCDYNKKQIKLSKAAEDVLSPFEILDTILHEVAHALTEGDKHGAKWKAKCIELGAIPNRFGKR